MTEQEQKFMDSAPKMTEQNIREINALFQAYIFRRRKNREIWTSCCGVHKVIRKNGETDAEYEILNAPHTPEPVMRYWGGRINKEEASRRVTCPYCGAEAKLKELGRTGNRDNLWSYRRPVILRQWRGKLWAMAYDAVKSYRSEAWLDARPDYKLLALYCFEPGRARMYGSVNGIESGWAHENTITAPGKKRWMLSAPYNCSTEYGTGYDICATDEINKSAFRYCGIQKLVRNGCDLIRLLTLCCFYPKQVEFLEKTGLVEIVKQYTERGVKSSGAVKWDAEDPREFLGVRPKEAMMLSTRPNQADILRTYRKLKGTKSEATMEECMELCGKFDPSAQKTMCAKMAKHGMTIAKLVSYLNDQRMEKQTEYQIGEIYRDYLIAAEGIGLNLSNSIFLMPKNLNRKHDEVTAEYAYVLSQKRSAKEKEKYETRRQKLEKKYRFGYGGLTVCVPFGSEDIVQEGKRLHHCVGGYAQRHIEGAVTILFLRRNEKVPMVTIEMSGNNIRQIHGWDDERTACPENPKRTPCMKLYAEFLTVWLDWLKAGSKRDKKGNPIIPKKYLQQEVKTA